jgi:hypothetical protein
VRTDREAAKSDLCDKQRVWRTVTATDEFHMVRFDELNKEIRLIAQWDFAGKIGI